MASMGPSQDALKIFHYTTPFVIFSYYVAASLWGICTLQAAPAVLHKKLTTIILALMSLMITTYVAESVVIIVQIFTSGGRFAGQDSNVYAISGALLSTVLSASIFESENHQWYPYWGAWTLMLIAEIVITFLTLTLARPTSPMEFLQVLLPSLRILVLAFLVAVYFTLSHASTTARDEESVPLLGESQQSRQQTQGAIASEETTVTASTDSEVNKREKKKQEQLARLQARLTAEGNWFKYASGFSVFFPHIWPTKRPLLLINMCGVAVCLLGERALNILVPRQLGFLVNFLSDGKSHESFVALGLYVFFEWLNSYSGIKSVRASLWVPVESNARESLDTASYDHIMELSCDFHDEKQQGELFTAMRQGSSLVDLLESLLYELLPVIIDLILALGYFYILFDSYLVLIGAATMIVYFWVSIYISAIQVKLQRKANASIRKKYQYLYDSMGDWRTVSYFNQIPHAERMYAASVSFSQSLWRQLRKLMYVGLGVQSLILDLGCFAAFFFAVYQVVYNGKTLGSFMTLLTYWSSFVGPLMTIASTQKHLLNDLVDAEELLTLFRRKPSVEDGQNELNITQAEVTFEEVKFMYDSRKDIVNNLSLKAEAGKTIALIGETGAGKSTVLKLLFRFYDVAEGSIKIDGQDIRNVTLDSLRRFIGVVPQDPSLFNDTIIANLRYAKLDATEEEIFEACRAAAIHDQILTFADGYKSVVGERGVRLSGGELQRIAIARAILKDPKIILLDEATSSVDNETEEKIQEGLRRLCKGRTTFVIAHRLSTILDADLIIVMKSGSILEQGTPAELLKSKGKYYSLWSKQMGIVDAMAKQQATDTLEDGPVLEEQASLQSQKADTQSDLSALEEAQQEISEDTNGQKQTDTPRIKGSFRPEAPEFIPSKMTNDHASREENSRQQLSLLSTNWQEAIDGNQEKAMKQRSQRRKPRQQPSSNFKPDDHTKRDEIATTEVADGPDSKKRRMSYRRRSSKSEPAESDQSANFGFNATRNTENDQPSTDTRRVSAPTDASRRLASFRAFSHTDRLRRQGNWRARDTSTNSESATSSQPSGDWSSEGGDSSSQPTPSIPTPGEGGLASNVPARVVAGAARFSTGT